MLHTYNRKEGCYECMLIEKDKELIKLQYKVKEAIEEMFPCCTSKKFCNKDNFCLGCSLRKAILKKLNLGEKE
jgi:hypothetical protein